MPCNGVNIFSSVVLNARKLVFGAEGANSKGADPSGPICAFVIHLLESTISELASNEILIFQLVSVAEQAGLNLNKATFVASRPIYFLLLYTAIMNRFIWTLPSTLQNYKTTCINFPRNTCPDTLENHMTKLQMSKYI